MSEHQHQDTCEYTVMFEPLNDDIWLYCESHNGWVKNMGMAPRIVDIIKEYAEVGRG